MFMYNVVTSLPWLCLKLSTSFDDILADKSQPLLYRLLFVLYTALPNPTLCPNVNSTRGP